MGLTIYTRHAAASTLRYEGDEAKIETEPVTGAVMVIHPKTGAFIARVSAPDFALMVNDDVTVTATPPPVTP